MKLYQVIFEDEYNNLYLIGFYKKLSDSVPEINKYLSDDFDKLNDGDLVVDSETLLKEIDYDRN